MFEQLRTRLAHWLRYRETVAELSARDPHILRDMGFEQTNMESIRSCAKMAVEDRCG